MRESFLIIISCLVREDAGDVRHAFGANSSNFKTLKLRQKIDTSFATCVAFIREQVFKKSLNKDSAQRTIIYSVYFYFPSITTS